MVGFFMLKSENFSISNKSLSMYKHIYISKFNTRSETKKKGIWILSINIFHNSKKRYKAKIDL